MIVTYMHALFSCSLISLLEYAEEHLDCTHVFVGLLKDRKDRGEGNILHSVQTPSVMIITGTHF